MKRCPHCRRDYYDDSLRYCLDDGALLLEGPGRDEPSTLVLQHAAPAELYLPRPTTHHIPSENLQLELSTLVGRKKQVAEISELVSQDAVRLITLTGIGGTGKTRLALELLRLLGCDFPDGAVFIELGSLNDATLVLPTIAQALGLYEADTRTAFDALVDHLTDRSVLLILDNFEQIISAGSDLAQLLKLLPNLKVMVTSRELLRLTGEIEYAVPPLGLPSDDASRSISDLQDYEAVQLFIECAVRVRPDFELNAENAASVAAICSKLDGLPLAIELAAARLKVLSVDEILQRLENRLAVLTGGSRDKPLRQQTMRAAIEWSYALLTDREKNIFCTLSVFAGGFMFRDAEAVLSRIAGREAADEILDDITSLTEKNLLISERVDDGQLRFRMLAVVRDLASELLESGGAGERARRMHAEYYLGLAEESVDDVRFTKSAGYLRRLETELENFRSAIRWCLENNAEMAAVLAVSLRSVWAVNGHIREGQYWLREILRRTASITPKTRWEVLTVLGNLTQFRGEIDAAREIYQTCLDDSRQYEDKKQISQSLRGVAAVEYLQNSFDPARSKISESLEISRSINDDFGAGAALARLGDIAMALGDYAESRRFTSEALAIFRKLGYEQGIAAKLSNLGAADFMDADIETARLHLRECLQMCDRIGDEIDIRTALDGFAALKVHDGDLIVAARLSGASQRVAESIDYVPEPAEKRFRENYMERLRALMKADDIDAAIDDGRKMSVDEAIAAALS